MKKYKNYIINVYLDSDVVAEDEDEALQIAQDYLKNGYYSLEIVDAENI